MASAKAGAPRWHFAFGLDCAIRLVQPTCAINCALSLACPVPVSTCSSAAVTRLRELSTKLSEERIRSSMGGGGA